MSAIAFQITGVWIVCSTVCWGIDRSLDGVSNPQPHDYLTNILISRRSKKASNLRVTGLCEENPQVTRRFPLQRTSNTENVSIYDVIIFLYLVSPVSHMQNHAFVYSLSCCIYYDLERNMQLNKNVFCGGTGTERGKSVGLNFGRWQHRQLSKWQLWVASDENFVNITPITW